MDGNKISASAVSRSEWKAEDIERKKKRRRKKSVKTTASFASTEAAWTKKVSENNVQLRIHRSCLDVKMVIVFTYLFWSRRLPWMRTVHCFHWLFSLLFFSTSSAFHRLQGNSRGWNFVFPIFWHNEKKYFFRWFIFFYNQKNQIFARFLLFMCSVRSQKHGPALVHGVVNSYYLF